MYRIAIKWNYNATSHGKGPIDDLGAVVKRIASNQVLTRKAIINNAEDFYHVVSNNNPNFQISLILSAHIHQRSSELNLHEIFQKLNNVKGISTFHYFSFLDDYLQTKRYSSESETTTSKIKVAKKKRKGN